MSGYMGVQVVQEDPEDFSTGTDDDSVVRRLSPKRFFTAAALLLGLAATASAVKVLSASPSATDPHAVDTQPTMTARSLLESKDFAEIAASNIRKITGGEIDVSAKDAAEKVRDMIAKTQTDDPETYGALNDRRLKLSQKDAVTNMMKQITDPRVLKIGEEVIRAIHEGHQVGGREGAKRRLLETFQSRLGEMQALKNKLIPAELRNIAAEGGKVTLNPDKLHLVQELEDSTHIEFNVERKLSDNNNGGSDVSNSGTTGSMLTGKLGKDVSNKFEIGLSLVGGLMDQSRIALNMVDQLGENFGKELGIPWFSKSLMGGGAFLVQSGGCAMRTNDGGGHKGYNNIKLLMCPLKYASGFFDLLGGIDNLVGLDNNHFYKGTSGQPQTQPQQGGLPFFGNPAPAPPPFFGGAPQPAQQQGFFGR
jgi:hypothetical protein